MTFPRTERIYEYEGSEYIVHGVTLFKNVIAQNVLKSTNKNATSHLYEFNWWKFMLNATFKRSNKLSKVY